MGDGRSPLHGASTQLMCCGTHDGTSYGTPIVAVASARAGVQGGAPATSSLKTADSPALAQEMAGGSIAAMAGMM